MGSPCAPTLIYFFYYFFNSLLYFSAMIKMVSNPLPFAGVVYSGSITGTCARYFLASVCEGMSFAYFFGSLLLSMS